MGYGLIVEVAAIVLAAVYVFATEASIWLKVLVVSLLLASFEWRYGFFLRAGLAVALSLYFSYVKARNNVM